MKTIESLANFVNCPATDIHACGKVSVLVSVYGKGVVFNRFFVDRVLYTWEESDTVSHLYVRFDGRWVSVRWDGCDYAVDECI